MAITKEILKTKLELNGILKGIEPAVKADGTVVENTMVITIENPKTKGLVEVRVFTRDYDKVQVWDNNSRTMNSYSVEVVNNDETLKKNALKKHIVGGKTTKEYLTLKEFLDDLAKFKGKPIKAEGNIDFSVYNGYLQQNLSVNKVTAIKSTDTMGLSAKFNAMISKEQFYSIKPNVPIEMYIPLKKDKQWFKMSCMFSADTFLEGMLKGNIEDLTFLLETTKESVKAESVDAPYYIVPLVCELENGKGSREPMEEDIPLVKRTVLKMRAKNNEEEYKKLITEVLKGMEVIPMETGSMSVTYLLGTSARLETENNPLIFSNSLENENKQKTATAMEILQQRKASQMASNASVVQQQEDIQAKVEESKSVTIEEKVEQAVPTETVAEEDTSDFPF